jgi:radical SAM protein with 4Fe4S-binding SPASM domain
MDSGETMLELTTQPDEKKKRKGTALPAVMDENCSSCAGSPLCELHCPVENCINLLYERNPGRRAEALSGLGRQR